MSRGRGSTGPPGNKRDHADWRRSVSAKRLDGDHPGDSISRNILRDSNRGTEFYAATPGGGGQCGTGWPGWFARRTCAASRRTQGGSRVLCTCARYAQEGAGSGLEYQRQHTDRRGSNARLARVKGYDRPSRRETVAGTDYGGHGKRGRSSGVVAAAVPRGGVDAFAGASLPGRRRPRFADGGGEQYWLLWTLRTHMAGIRGRACALDGLRGGTNRARPGGGWHGEGLPVSGYGGVRGRQRARPHSRTDLEEQQGNSFRTPAVSGRSVGLLPDVLLRGCLQGRMHLDVAFPAGPAGQ